LIEPGSFKVGVDVVVELVLPRHRLLADVAEEPGTLKQAIESLELKYLILTVQKA
jgi:hypothetical protein